MADPRVIFITGTSSGFGMLTAVECAARGHRVIAAMRDPGRKDRLLELAGGRQAADRIDIVPLDVTDEDAASRAIADAVGRYGRLDMLVNNAGYAQGGMAEDVPLSAWRAQMETNFFAAVRLVQLVLPHMRQRRSGLIVNVSSISGRVAMPGFGPYCASKFALEGFSEALRLELAPFGIRVVLVEPGSYRTDIWRKGFELAVRSADSPYRDLAESVFRMARQSAERAPDPAEVARRIADLADDPAPPLRLPLGRGVRSLLAVRSLLPWNWYERMIRRALGV